MQWWRKIREKVKQRFAEYQKIPKRTRRRTYITVAAIVLVWACFNSGGTLPEQKTAIPPVISYSEFLKKVGDGEVIEARIGVGVITGVLKGGASVMAKVDVAFVNPVDELRKHGVNFKFVTAEDESAAPRSYTMLYVILILFVWGYFYFWGIGPKGEIHLRFWRKASSIDTTKRTFADVAGVDEAKADLQEVVDFLRDPERFTRLGGKIPKGALLVGPPGTGKTLLARAIAGEANVPFFHRAGSDFVEMFVGVGASRVRKLSNDAKANAPCIVYIDEIDAIGGRRTGSSTGGEREYQQTLNQLLAELDGFIEHPGVIFMASTNRPEDLDPALLRPGRLTWHIVVPLPDARGREAILKIHTRKLSLAPDVDLVAIALGTPGFSGADLANLANEAALFAGRDNPPAKKVAMRHFMQAKDKVLIGAERKSLILTEADKFRTAYHEVGHAFVAMRTEGSDPVEKISIMPRGRTLGVTVQLPPADRHHYTKRFLLSRMVIMMGGRAAEEIFFGADDISAGAESDIEEATKLASNMVCRWGMSDLGPIALKKQIGAYLGSISGYDCSPALAYRADEEIKSMLEVALTEAHAIIEKEREAMVRVTKALLERTELSGLEIQQIIDGRELPKLTIPSPDG